MLPDPLVSSGSLFHIDGPLYDSLCKPLRRIDISVLQCVMCSQLLLLCFPEVVSINAFLNGQINIFYCKRIKCYFFTLIIFFTVNVYLLPVTKKRLIIVLKNY